MSATRATVIAEGRFPHLFGWNEFANLHCDVHLILAIPRDAWNDSKTIETYIIRCTTNKPLPKGGPWNDFFMYTDNSIPDDPRFGFDRVARLKLSLLFCSQRRAERHTVTKNNLKQETAYFVPIRRLHIALRENGSQKRRAITKVRWAETKIEVMRAGSIVQGVCVVPILPRVASIPFSGKASKAQYTCRRWLRSIVSQRDLYWITGWMRTHLILITEIV